MNLSDFPPDVQALARETYERRPITVCGIAEAIMADRAGRLDTAGLTTQQSACLRAIAEHQAQHGISPTHDELASALGLASKSGVARLLLALETRGRIQRLPNRSRAITIIANPN